MKKISWMFIVCILAICLMPTVFINHQENVVSYIDNRYLMNRSDIVDYYSFEDYFNDRLGGRYRMISIYQEMNYALFGTYDHDEITVGKSGHLFPKTYPNTLYSDYISDFADFIILMKQYFDDRNVPFYFELNPAKTSVLREYLPDGINYNDDWTTAFVEKLENHGVTVIDNIEYFRESDNAECYYNLKYDVAHWNDAGALYGNNHLFNIMHRDNEIINELSLEDFEISTVHQDHTLNNIKIDENIVEYIPQYDYSDLTEQYRNELLLDNNFNQFFHWQTGNEEKPSVLFFEGSYYIIGKKFFVANTNNYYGVHNYRNVENFDYYYNIFKPDIVVFEAAEYIFSEYYFSQWAMQHKTVSPALDENQETQISSQTLTLEVAEGKQISGVLISGLPKETNYCYLIMDGEVYDMKIEDIGTYRTDILTKNISQNAKVVYQIDNQYYEFSFE